MYVRLGSSESCGSTRYLHMRHRHMGCQPVLHAVLRPDAITVQQIAQLLTYLMSCSTELRSRRLHAGRSRATGRLDQAH